MRQLIVTMSLVLMGIVLYAQETTSEIQGVITDENNAPLTGATIMATHVPSGTKYSTTSRKEGRYNLPNLKVGGPYQIDVTFVGYEPARQDSVTLLLGRTLMQTHN